MVYFWPFASKAEVFVVCAPKSQVRTFTEIYTSFLCISYYTILTLHGSSLNTKWIDSENTSPRGLKKGIVTLSPQSGIKRGN